MRGEEASQTAVSVGDRMDRQEVENECADSDERMSCRFPLGLFIPCDQLTEQELGFGRRRRLEDDLATTVLEGDDEVLVGLQVATSAVGVLRQDAVKMEDEGDGERLRSSGTSTCRSRRGNRRTHALEHARRALFCRVRGQRPEE